MTLLRPLRESDIEGLLSWLPDAARAAGCKAWSNAASVSTAIERDDVLVAGDSGAFLHVECGEPQSGAARVRFLAVDPSQRRLGLGGRVALALEERLRGPAEKIYVTVPSDIGLALYFWLRLGYRPLTQQEWPARPKREPSVWMVRTIGR